jgi:hypothetical protein
MLASRLRSLALGAFALVVAATPAAAQPWGGAGASGLDPYGHAWQFTDTPLAWGIPGHGFGTISWTGPTLSSFEITFNGGSDISSDLDPTSFDATRMWNGRTNTFFDVFVSLDLHTAVFTAPAGSELMSGDLFFVNVVFEDTDRPTSFTAQYNVAAVPEPGTWALLATGLVAVAGVARRRRNG